MTYADSKGTDQPAHMRSLISDVGLQKYKMLEYIYVKLMRISVSASSLADLNLCFLLLLLLLLFFCFFCIHI